ncbi:MAG TPA: hypothetical protein VFF03_13190 [Rhodocyclaceae bacterium]|nr:hypothetical protein [Rhodocyclaceae bacterium]
MTRDILPTVMGGPIQLATLLQNLVENGIKYRGSEQPRIHAATFNSACLPIDEIREITATAYGNWQG